MSLKLAANVHLTLSRDGQLVHRESGHNRVVATGEELAARRFNPDDSELAPDYCAVGSGVSPVTSLDTGLESEHSGSRVQAYATGRATSQVQYAFEITATTTWEVNEVGIFNDPTAGIMVARILTQGFTMTLNDVLAVLWSLAFLGWDDEV